MRSRYTAYTLQNNDYIQKTWHTTTRPDLSARSSEPVKWTGLTVLSHEQEARSALVEFIARYKINGRAERLHERSRFVLEDGQWFYVDGEHLK
jgi:SEC-C motif-containing protein